MELLKSNDARSRIINAYLDEIQHKPYYKITVSAVIAGAGVNRSTFYRNFFDVFDLYEKVCDIVIELIKKEVDNDYVGEFISSLDCGELERNSANARIYRNALLKYKDAIIPLSGKNGDILFFKKLRSASKSFICERYRFMGYDIKLNDPQLLSFLADTELLFSCIMTTDIVEGTFEYKPCIPFYSPKKRIIDNIAAVKLAFSDEKSIVELKLIKAAYNLWCEKKTVAVTVSDITKKAGISRTEFYSFYKNIFDFYLQFEQAAASTLGLYVLQLCFSDSVDFGTRVNFELDKLNEDCVDLIGCIDHDRVFGFVFNTAVVYRNIFLSLVEKSEGIKLSEDMKIEMTGYFSAVMCAGMRYVLVGDETQMKRFIGMCYELRDELKLYDKNKTSDNSEK